MALLDPIVTAPRWQKLVLGIIGLAALGGAGYYFAVAPVELRVRTLMAQHESQQQEIVRTRAMVLDLTRARRRAVDVERQLEVAKERLPTEREMPSLYRTLSDAAVQAGLAVSLFQPRPARIRDFYSEIPITLVGEGGYHEVGDFVGRVAALPRTTTIGEFKLTGAEAPRPPPGPPGARRPPVEDRGSRGPATGETAKKPLVKAELTLLTYVYRPVGSPPAPKPAGATPAAAAPAPAAPKP